jgi:hypothetical protein
MPSPSPSPQFDLSWVWETLTSICDTIASWFESLWEDVTSKIVNTGQGIFSGLTSLGSIIWDALVKFAETIGSWFYNALKWIYDGFCFVANVFGEWVSYAFQWVGSGLNWIAQQLYNFGNWLYNGLVFIWNWIVNTATGIWNAIVSWFSGIATAIGNWWGSVTTSINAWFTNILKGIRQKMLQTVVADVGIYFGWKSVERLTQAKSLSDGVFGLFGMIASPFAGYLFGSIIDGLIPIASTEPFELIPTVGGFSYTPPSMTVEKPTEPTKPDMGTPPSAPPRVTERGLPLDTEASMTSTYDTTTSTKDKEAGLTTVVEYEVAP